MNTRLTLAVMMIFCLLVSCQTTPKVDPRQTKVQINSTLNRWHRAAANAQFEQYMAMFSPDAEFMGTDATEHWSLDSFKAYCAPHFARGKTWHFIPIQRHIRLNESCDLAWFDELLSTQMKICRGSGVLQKKEGQWKISQYVLSMTIPNEVSTAVIMNKTMVEDSLLASWPVLQP